VLGLFIAAASFAQAGEFKVSGIAFDVPARFEGSNPRVHSACHQLAHAIFRSADYRVRRCSRCHSGAPCSGLAAIPVADARRDRAPPNGVSRVCSPGDPGGWSSWLRGVVAGQGQRNRNQRKDVLHRYRSRACVLPRDGRWQCAERRHGSADQGCRECSQVLSLLRGRIAVGLALWPKVSQSGRRGGVSCADPQAPGRGGDGRA
jgi:hypothetical protein